MIAHRDERFAFRRQFRDKLSDRFGIAPSRRGRNEFGIQRRVVFFHRVDESLISFFRQRRIVGAAQKPDAFNSVMKNKVLDRLNNTVAIIRHDGGNIRKNRLETDRGYAESVDEISHFLFAHVPVHYGGKYQ
jgi:hypothetical protein